MAKRSLNTIQCSNNLDDLCAHEWWPICWLFVELKAWRVNVEVWAFLLVCALSTLRGFENIACFLSVAL